MAEATKQTFLQYLPAVFHKQPVDGTTEITLRDYLLPFEKVFQGFDELLATLDRYVAPQLTPREEFLPWLASWIALVLEAEWDERLQRRVIEEAVELYRWRGTVSGLKRYLQLYAGLAEEMVEIEEATWPAGMQIGVASRIGIAQPATAAPAPVSEEIELSQYDVYVVDTVVPSETGLRPARIYYRSDQVLKIDLEADQVRLWYRPAQTDPAVERCHPRPPTPALPDQTTHNIAFRGALVDYHYQRVPVKSGQDAIDYNGGSFLIERIPAPYHFIVHVKVPAADLQTQNKNVLDKKLASIRRVLDLEKPAHTEYYLKVSPAPDGVPRQWMQIEVHSSIGLDTTVA